MTSSSYNNEYTVIWYDDGSNFERIDVIAKLEDYNVIDTSTCDAAYYRKSKELYLGNEKLIRDIVKTRNMASVFKGKLEQSIEIVDGKVQIKQWKKNEGLGLYWEMLMENGFIVSEYYSTPEMQIEIFDVQKDKGLDIQPINLSNYMVYNIVADKIEAQASDAEYYSEEYLRAKYPAISHIDNYDFVVVSSMEEADERLRIFYNAPTKVKSIDLETTGTETGMYGQDVITGIVLSWRYGESTYYPFRQEKCDFNLPISYISKILEAVNTQSEDVVIVGYNAKFEIQGIWKESKYYIGYSEYAKKWDPQCEEHGLDDTYLRIDADAMFLSIIVNPEFKQKGLHTLKAEAYRADGQFYLELKEHIFKDPKNIKFNVLPPGIIKLYACPDGPNTINVYNRLLAMTPKHQLGVFRNENKMIYVTAENEFYGMRTQKQRLVELIENEEYIVNTLAEYFKKAHKTNGNINSPQLRRVIFYDKLRCPVEVRTNKGLPSTSNVALKRIVELGAIKKEDVDPNKIPPDILDLNGNVVIKGIDLASNRYPSLVILNKYAKSQKELGAYKRIQRTSLRDRVMFYMNQYGAATGRRTSDAHQYSDGMKSLIIADSNDHHLWSADFKQVELRLLAYLAGQKDLIELESDPDVDIHRAILSIIKGKPMWDISAEERKKGKATNFGVVYMMSPFGLAKQNAGPAYTKSDYEDALASINDFYNGMPKINQFTLNNEKFLRENGYIETAFGRRRNFERLLDPTYPERDKASLIRAGNNMPVQGFGADLLKQVELNLREYIIEKGWDEKVDCDGVMLPKVRLMLSIHDEVLVSTHKSIPIAAIITMFKECMEIQIEGAPPFFAAPALVRNWLDGKNDAYECDLRFRDEIVEAWVNEGKELIHPETYLEDLDNFRARRLNTYMDDLIRQYKTAEEVAVHVQHSELTHTLISAYVGKEKGFTHRESILEATKRYMARHAERLSVEIFNSTDAATDTKAATALDALNNLMQEVQSTEKVSYTGGKDDRSEKQGLTSFEELEEFIYFDENGEAIFEEDEEGAEVDDLSTLQETSMYVKSTVERTRALYSIDQVFIDLNDLKLADPRTHKIYKAMIDLYDPDGEYKVLFMIDGQIRGIDFHVKYIPDKITKLIESIIEEES